jgi:alkylhydroperoxidase family enzyme
MSAVGFLGVPEPTAEAQRMFAEDVGELGFVMNASRLWAYHPAVADGLFDLMREATEAHQLTLRQRGILVAAANSAIGNSYCSLAWGTKLAKAADAQTAAAVLRGDDTGLTASEQAMAVWARKAASNPNHTSAADVQALRDAGYGDTQIFAITVFVALRVAFSIVNDALGACPDAAFRSTAPKAVLDAITFGRPIDEATAATEDPTPAAGA